MAVYTGTAANNSYTGTGSADTLAGRAGNDTLYGGLGSDRILGEDGNDSLFGGNGADVILAGNGNDSLDGGNGNDSLDGGIGNDTLTAGAGNDRLAAGDGNDRLVAGDGDDVADGGNGVDTVDGGAGADTLTAGQGDDRLGGGSGNDSLGGGNGADSMLGDADDDRIDGGGGNDSLAGGDGQDSLIGWTGLDRLDGGNGNDVLSGGNDADILFGGAGDDTADGGSGDDTFAAGAGNDTFAGGTGTDTVLFAGNISSYQIVGSGSSVRFIDLATLDGDDGTDLVSGAETIVFANRTVTFASLLNAAPDAQDDVIAAAEDGPAVTGSLFGNDSDPNGDALTVAAVNGLPGSVGSTVVLASGARLLVSANGSYRFNPNGGYESLGDGQQATYRFTYTVSDGRGGSDRAAAAVTITGVNDAPVAGDDTADASAAASVVGNVLANDEDVDSGARLTVTAVNGSDTAVGGEITLASGARLTLGADGDYTYDPAGAFTALDRGETATDSFSYTVGDGHGGSDTATVTVTITGVDGTPDAVDDGVTADEDLGASGNDLLADDTDPDGDGLSIVAVNGATGAVGTRITLASGALLTVNADGSYSYDSNGAFEALGDGETASDSFSYTVEDGNGDTDTASVEVTITGANDAPDAVDDGFTADEDIGATDTGLLGNDTDAEDDALTVTAVNGADETVGTPIALASGARLTVNADGSYTYDTNGAFEGLGVGATDTDSFTYTVSDGNGSTDTATVEVTIIGANDTPDAVDDTFEVDAGDSGGPILGTVPPGFGDSLLDNDEDPDGDTLTVTAIDAQDTAVGTPVALASGALLTVNAEGTYTYDPNGAFDYLGADESDEDSFTYTISDGNGGHDSATVSVTVNGVNDDPTADDAHLDIYEADGTYSGNLLDYAADADLNDTLVISAINGASGFAGTGFQIETGAWLTVNADGTFTLEPPRAANSGETLEGSFDYTVSDGNGGFATATISFTVYGDGIES